MVYLIHFERPYFHACHYLGFVKSNLDQRIEQHRAGNGARLLQVVTQAGIDWRVVRTWPQGNRSLERRLKRQKNAWKHCPICRAKRIAGH